MRGVRASWGGIMQGGKPNRLRTYLSLPADASSSASYARTRANAHARAYTHSSVSSTQSRLPVGLSFSPSLQISGAVPACMIQRNRNIRITGMSKMNYPVVHFHKTDENNNNRTVLYLHIRLQVCRGAAHTSFDYSLLLLRTSVLRSSENV